MTRLKQLLEASYYRTSGDRVYTFKWRRGSKGKVQTVRIKPENLKKHYPQLIDPPKDSPWRQRVIGKVRPSGSLQPSKKKDVASGAGGAKTPQDPMKRLVSIEQKTLIGPGPFTKQLVGVLKAIESVHKIPDALPTVPTVQAIPKQKCNGSYTFAPEPPHKPVAILINSETKYPALSFAHELGHMIDHHVMAGPGTWGSHKDPAMQTLMAALHQTKAIQTLKVARDAGVLPRTPHPGDTEVKYKKLHSGIAAYMMEDHEIFARAYSQYIATKSGNKDILAQLGVKRHDGTKEPGKAYYPDHWDDDDFAPIMKAFDDLFRSKGWLKE